MCEKEEGVHSVQGDSPVSSSLWEDRAGCLDAIMVGVFIIISNAFYGPPGGG